MEIELAGLGEGEDPIAAAWQLLDRHEIKLVGGKLPQLLRVADAVTAAADGATAEMQKKCRTAGALVEELRGYVLLERLPDGART